LQADVERVRYRNALDCTAQLYKSRGIRGFFAGLTVTCCRAFPVSAVTFLLYSQTLGYLGRSQQLSTSGGDVRPKVADSPASLDAVGAEEHDRTVALKSSRLLQATLADVDVS